MPRRSPAELLAEHDRLRSCLDVLAAVLGPVLEPDDPRYLVDGLVSAETTRAAVLNGAARASDVLAGAREAIADLTRAVEDLGRRAPDKAGFVLDAYRATTGRDLWKDADHPGRLLRAILKRGFIANETEYRLVADYLADMATGLLTDAQRDTAGQMLARFPDRPQ